VKSVTEISDVFVIPFHLEPTYEQQKGPRTDIIQEQNKDKDEDKQMTLIEATPEFIITSNFESQEIVQQNEQEQEEPQEVSQWSTSRGSVLKYVNQSSALVNPPSSHTDKHHIDRQELRREEVPVSDSPMLSQLYQRLRANNNIQNNNSINEGQQELQRREETQYINPSLPGNFNHQNSMALASSSLSLPQQQVLQEPILVTRPNHNHCEEEMQREKMRQEIGMALLKNIHELRMQKQMEYNEEMAQLRQLEEITRSTFFYK